MTKVPRGSLYHNFSDELSTLFKSFFLDLNNERLISLFEQKFAGYNGRKYGCTFPFARTAFYYSIKSLKIEKGSEVILSPITIKPILDVILDLELKPIFCDLDLDTLCYDENELQLKINSKTKLIITTYLFGMVPNMDYYESLKKRKIHLIEDFSQCLNGRYKKKTIGSFGDISIYSCSSIKTLDTYGGGIAVTDSNSFFLKLKKYQSDLFAPSRFFLIKKITINLIRNILTNYYVFTFFTYYLIRIINLFDNNSKMLGSRPQSPLDKLPTIWFQKYTSIQAMVGLKKIEKIANEDKIRIDLAEKIKSNLKAYDIKFPKGLSLSKNVYWQLIFFTKNRDEIRKILFENGIDTSSTSLEKLCTLKEYNFNYKLPNTEKIYNETLFFPCFSKIHKKQIKKIFQVINLLNR